MTDLFLDMIGRYGMKEVDGTNSNPDILAMFKELGYSIKDDSETAWCSASLSYFAKKNGYEYNKTLAARDWLRVGSVTLTPKVGDVVVLWREKPDSWKGHVGLFVSMDDKFINILGGNQGNALNIMPFRRDRVLGFRTLLKKK